MNVIAQLFQQLSSVSALHLSSQQAETTEELHQSDEDKLADLNLRLNTSMDMPTYQQLLKDDGSVDQNSLFAYLIKIAMDTGDESTNDVGTGAAAAVTALLTEGTRNETTTVNTQVLHDVLAREYGANAVQGIFDQNNQIDYSALSTLLATSGAGRTGQLLDFKA